MVSFRKDEAVLPTGQFIEKTAGFWVRFWAFLIDGLIVTAIVGIVINPVFYLMDWSLLKTPWYAPMAIITVIVYYSYFIVMTKTWQQTIGKMIFGLRVVTYDGQKPNFATVIFRELIGRTISNILFYIPYAAVAFTPKNQSLADYVADTKVIHEKTYTKQQNIVAQPHEIEYMI